MHATIFRAALLTSAFAILISPTRAVTYTATLLHPDDFQTTNGSGSSNGSQVGQGYQPDFPGGPHAMLWHGNANSFVDLNGASFTATYGAAATDTYQIGDGYGPTTGGQFHSLLWSGTAGSVVDLNPASFDVSHGLDVDGTHAVGYGFSTDDFLSRALLWDVTTHNSVNLHPAGFNESFANGVSGDKQAGYGLTASDVPHALLWSGTPGSKVDLNPTGFTESFANDVYTNGSTSTQVGSGAGPNSAQTNGETHALMWTGTAASKVDLNPAGYSFSEAIGISAAGQVGDGYGEATSGAYHALYWNGAANPVVDLHSVLFAGTGYNFVSSSAYDIAPNGNIVGTATDDGFFTYAVLWTPISEESGVAGDYDNNGTVDAGDYVAWRKGNNPLRNEVTTINSNTPADYTEWRKRFGNNTGSGASIGDTAIPEPASIAVLCIALFSITFARPTNRRTRLGVDSVLS